MDFLVLRERRRLCDESHRLLRGVVGNNVEAQGDQQRDSGARGRTSQTSHGFGSIPASAESYEDSLHR